MGAETGTVDNCLIIPTQRLCSILDKFAVKATFFVDAAYLYKLHELKGSHPALNTDFKNVSTQIKELISWGHDIQLHIHPQWYYAQYANGRWRLDESCYKLSDLPADSVKRLFLESKKLLESVSGRQVTAYRAGGYSIQSYPDVVDLFQSAGIRVDCSVLPGRSVLTGPQYFDYRSIPAATLYSFTNNVTKEEEGGKFLELPITTGRVSLLEFYRNYIRYKRIPLSHATFGDGKPACIASTEKNRIRRLLNESKEYRAASIDNGGVMFLSVTYSHHKDKERFVIIGHPKNLSEASLKELDSFLSIKSWENTFELVSSVI